jgi:hypothetical protein
MFSFEVIFHWYTEVEIMHEVWAEWWMVKTFLVICGDDAFDSSLGHEYSPSSCPGPCNNNNGM